MRSARAAVHAALPLLGLAALAAFGAVRDPGPPADGLLFAGDGRGSLSPTVVVRIVTDGRPQLVTIPVHQAPLPKVSSPTPSPATPPAARTSPVAKPVTAPRTGTIPAPRTAPATVPRAVSSADAYPYAADTTGGSDQWGFTMRQCVSYVAWRLADVGRPIDNGSQHWGSAFDWEDRARDLGYGVSTHPAIGSVAQWGANEQSPYWSAGSSTANGLFIAGTNGHVAWVTKVYADGSVLVAQYNGTSERSFSTMRVQAPRYLSL